MPRVRVLDVVVPALLLGVVALGCVLRLQDPLSSHVIGAEDPYTHLVLTKEAVARGFFGKSDWLGLNMYPPGLHALGGILATDSGTPLEQWTMFAPIAFGAIAIVGTFVLANRLAAPRGARGITPAGAAAGLVAAFLVATMPEHIFRTELYFPTALDMAILPAYILAFVLATEGDASRVQRGGGALLFAVLTPALAFTHPWAVPLVLVPAALWLALRVLRAGAPFRGSLARLIPGAALVILGTAFAMASRWDHSESGFATLADHLGPMRALSSLALPGIVLFPIFVVILGLCAIPAVLLAAAMAPVRLPRAARITLAIVLAIVAVEGTRYIAITHFPPGVNYGNMLGSMPIRLAMLGVALAFLAPLSLLDLGISLGAFLFPLTAINVFNSPFWPQRTVVYLSLGVALLAGGAVASLLNLLLAWRPLAAPRRASWVAPIAALAAVLLVAGAVNAAPAQPYTWYRLYTDQEYSAIKDTSAMLAKDPTGKILVYSWQPGLFLKATGNPSQVMYCPQCYQDAGARASKEREWGGNVYVVVDGYTDKDSASGKADASWATSGHLVLQSGSWRVYQVSR